MGSEARSTIVPPEIETELDRFLETLQSRWGEELISVVLFGSWARGEAKEGSDIDLFIVKEGLPRNRSDRYREMLAVKETLPPEFAERISTILYTPEDACIVKPFYLGILTAHCILYDRDGFFQSLLSNLQAKLDALGAERLLDEEGYEYWLLKKDWKPGDVVEL